MWKIDKAIPMGFGDVCLSVGFQYFAWVSGDTGLEFVCRLYAHVTVFITGGRERVGLGYVPIYCWGVFNIKKKRAINDQLISTYKIQISLARTILISKQFHFKIS